VRARACRAVSFSRWRAHPAEQDRAPLQGHPRPGKGGAAGGWSGVFIELLSGNSKRPAPRGTCGKRRRVTCCIFFSFDKCVLNVSGTWVPWECRGGGEWPWLTSLLWASFLGEFQLRGRSPSRMQRQNVCEPGSKGRSGACWGLFASSCLGGCSSAQTRRGLVAVRASRACSGYPRVTLPPLCWEGGGRLAFGAGCSSALYPPAAGVSMGQWLLGRSFRGRDCTCFRGYKARAAPVSFFSLLRLAWLVLLVMLVGFSQPLRAVWPLQQNLESPFAWVPRLRRGRLRALPLGCMQGTRLLVGWWHPKVALPTSPP